MYGSIVVGTDGTAGAAIAVAHAVELARLSGGTLHLVSVGKPPTSALMGDGMVAPIGMQLDPDALMGDLKAVLDHSAAPAQTAGVKVETHAVLGSPAEMLVEVAKDVDADVIVVGNRGMLGARRFLGSVPNAVAHHAPCSVLIVETQHEH